MNPEKQPIAGEKQPIAGEKQPIAGEKQPIAGEKQLEKNFELLLWLLMVKTIDALTKSMGTDALIAAGEVVELRFRDNARVLSLRSAKLFHLLINHAGAKACEDQEHHVPIAELNFSHLEAEVLVECVRDLVGTLVELTYRDGKGGLRTKHGPLLSDVDRDHDHKNGDLTYRLSPALRLALENSKHWAALSRTAVLAFESRYALRLYELMTLRGGLTHKNVETFELEDLRRRLGVPTGKMPRWSNFKQKVLDTALIEVNQFSGLKVTYEVIKRGRRIDRVSLTWTQRDSPGRAEVARDLIHSGLGEKAQHEGAVEAIRPALPHIERAIFPTQGSLKHGQRIARWRELAEKHVNRLSGGHLPDMAVLADQFRAFCEKKNVPLNAKGIEKTFIGFCERYNPPS